MRPSYFASRPPSKGRSDASLKPESACESSAYPLSFWLSYQKSPIFAPSRGKIKAREPRGMLLDNDSLIRYMLRLGQAHMIRQSVRMLKQIHDSQFTHLTIATI